MNAEDLGALGDTMPFAALLGVELLEATPDRVRARLEWTAELCTLGTVMHGGAIMALADTCGAVCAVLSLPAGATATTTIESKTNFLRAIQSGTVIATTTPLHKGRTMIVVETEIRRDDDRLAAKVTQTQTYLYPRS